MRTLLALALAVPAAALAVAAGTFGTFEAPGEALPADDAAGWSDRLVVEVRDVPREGGIAQVALLARAPVKVMVETEEAWSAAGVSFADAMLSLWTFPDGSLQGGAATLGGTLAAARAGPVGVACCAAAVRDVPPSVLPTGGSAGSGSGFEVVLAPGRPLVLTVAATSWEEGSVVRFEARASSPALRAEHAAPLEGGVHRLDLLHGAEADGTYAEVPGVRVGERGEAAFDVPVARGHVVFASLHPDMEKGGEVGLAWNLPGGEAGRVAHHDAVTLLAAGRGRGTVQLVAWAADGGLPADVLATPWGTAVIVDVDPRGTSFDLRLG